MQLKLADCCRLIRCVTVSLKRTQQCSSTRLSEMASCRARLRGPARYKECVAAPRSPLALNTSPLALALARADCLSWVQLQDAILLFRTPHLRSHCQPCCAAPSLESTPRHHNTHVNTIMSRGQPTNTPWHTACRTTANLSDMATSSWPRRCCQTCDTL